MEKLLLQKTNPAKLDKNPVMRDYSLHGKNVYAKSACPPLCGFKPLTSYAKQQKTKAALSGADNFFKGSKPVFILTVLCVMVFKGQPSSQAGLGMYGGAYLREPVGATAFSLGGAQTASPRYLCSWWNPAVLASLKQKRVALGVGYRPLGRTEGYLGFEFTVPPRVGLGFSVLYRGIPAIKGLVDEQEYPLEECAYETFSFKVGLSYLIKRNFYAGMNLSVCYQSLPTGFEEINGTNNIIYSSATEIGGLDLALYYIPNKRLSYGLVMKNLLASFKWEFTDDNFSPIYDDILPATITIGQEFRTSLLGKPFLWSCDIISYVLDSRFKSLDRNNMVVNNGFEWQRWKLFFIRAGIRDMVLNSDIFRNSSQYKDHFTLVASAGFLLDLSTALKGRDVIVNYAFSTDKVGAGLEQQLDFVFSF